MKNRKLFPCLDWPGKKLPKSIHLARLEVWKSIPLSPANPQVPLTWGNWCDIVEAEGGVVYQPNIRDIYILGRWNIVEKYCPCHISITYKALQRWQFLFYCDQCLMKSFCGFYREGLSGFILLKRFWVKWKQLKVYISYKKISTPKHFLAFRGR